MRRFLISYEKVVSTAHLYYQRKWDSDKNKKEFGLCFSKAGHGHNYIMSLTWQVLKDDFESESEFDRDARKTLESVCHHYDHKHLFFDHPAFVEGGLIPTTEGIASQVWKEFQEEWGKVKSDKVSPSGVTVWELNDLYSTAGESIDALSSVGTAKRKIIRTGVALGPKKIPLSLLIKIENHSTLDLPKLIKDQSQAESSVYSLANKLANTLQSPIYIETGSGIKIFMREG